MVDRVSEIYKRMKVIQNGAKNFSQLKPERVSDFENMYKQAISNKKVETGSLKDEIHPYLETEKNSVEQNDVQPALLSKAEKINDAVKKASEKYRVSEDLIRAVIQVESGFNPRSVSKAGAMGLMQLMPGTSLELNVEKPFGIYENIDGGVRYLKKMLYRYNDNLDKALAAYNAGPHRVDRDNGVPNIEETQNYIKTIKKILFKL